MNTTTQTMPAITIRQPWASSVIRGDKRIETRSRNTKIRGRIAIHSALCHIHDGDVFETFLKHGSVVKRFEEGEFRGCYTMGRGIDFGSILGTVDLVDCVLLSDMQSKYPELVTEKEIDLGDWSPGRYGWILRDPIIFENPIPAKGKQGWWKWEVT